jgi:hypothetical protein
MNTPILHQYPASPFSEKIRLILGYRRLAYRTVEIPVAMPPRPPRGKRSHLIVAVRLGDATSSQSFTAASLAESRRTSATTRIFPGESLALSGGVCGRLAEVRQPRSGRSNTAG